jgi:hypothetical protein
MSRAWIRALAAVAILAAILGADKPSRTADVRSDRPPAERRVDPRRERVVEIRVIEADGPYTITVEAREQGNTTSTRTGPKKHIGEYRQTLGYMSGQRIHVTLQVEGSPQDTFECRIRDGWNRDVDRGHGTALCAITTHR